MDAASGTSNGTGSMGHSASKSHSSVDAAESGHRSRSADVGLEGEGIIDIDPSTPVASLGDSAPNAFGPDEAPNGLSGSTTTPEMFFGEIAAFSTPRRTSRSSSPRSSSPRLNPARWFTSSVLTVEDGADEPEVSHNGPRIDWSESTDADGLGTIPADWIKQESKSVDLNWSVSDAGNEFIVDSLARELNDSLTPKQQELIRRRNETLKTMNVRRGSAASSHTTQPISTIANNVASTSARPDIVPTASPSIDTPRIPAALKGKGKAVDESRRPTVEDYFSDDEDGYNPRAAQVAADAELAHQMQAGFTNTPGFKIYEKAKPSGAGEPTVAPEPKGKAKAVNGNNLDTQIQADAFLAYQVQKSLDSEGMEGKTVAGPSNSGGVVDNSIVQHPQIVQDANLARQMQSMFDEHYSQVRKLQEQHDSLGQQRNSLDDERNALDDRRTALDEQQRIIDNARRDLDDRIQTLNDTPVIIPHTAVAQPAIDQFKIETTATLKNRPTPMDQVPRNSVLFQDIAGSSRQQGNGGEDPSDSSSSSSSSDDMPKFMHGRAKSKKSKKRRMKAKRARANSGTPGEEPSDSSSSSDSTESDENSNWSSLDEPPSEPDSDDSRRTRKKKQKAKRRWNLKLYRHKLEQSNAKPDPPFVYNGEPVFHKMERFVHESRSWARQSYIRPNMRVLADSVGDISERLLIVRFWEGARVAIQKEWAHDGYDPETSSMKQLVRAAVNYEQAQKLVDSIDKNKQQPRDRPDKNKPQAPKSGPRGREQQQGPKQRPSKVHWAERSDVDKTGNLRRANNGNGGGKNNWNNSKKPNTLTRAQKDEYCAQGKCFTCGETTHLSKDCPQNNSVRPPKRGVGSASVSFGEVERLRNLRDASDLGLFSLKFEQPRLSPQHLAALDDVLVERMRAELRTAVPFSWDCLDDPCEERDEQAFYVDRFVISPMGDGWVIVDRHLEIHHEVSRTQLLDTDFSLIEFICYRNSEIFRDQLTVNQPKRVFRRLRRKRELDAELTACESYFPQCDQDFDKYSTESLPDSVRIFSHFWGHAKADKCKSTPIRKILAAIQRQFAAATPYFFDTEEECEEMHSPIRFELICSENDSLTVWDTYHNREFNLSFEEVLSADWSPRMFIEKAYVDYEERRFRNPFPEEWLESNSEEPTDDAPTSSNTPPWMAPGTENEAYFSNRRNGHTQAPSESSDDSDMPGLYSVESSDVESSEYDSDSDDSDSEMPHLYSDSDSDDELGSDSETNSEMPDLQSVESTEDEASDYGRDTDESDAEMPCLYSDSDSDTEDSCSEVDCYLEIPRSRRTQIVVEDESDFGSEVDSENDEFFSACDWEDYQSDFNFDEASYSDMPDLQTASDSDSSDSEDDTNEIFDALNFKEKPVENPPRSTQPESLKVRWDRRLDQDDHWKIGDLLADGAQAVLEVLQPYPGDDLPPWEHRRDTLNRFDVTAWSEDDYLVWDELHHELTILPKRLLLIPRFQLAAWWRRKLLV
ncbi:hypothetical protein C8R45DRAFT_931844 [Mycena sanguinolenta]|nr:hypothetical protein C8R45DRAFT_931844 [Mycena sanguinolenta]